MSTATSSSKFSSAIVAGRFVSPSAGSAPSRSAMPDTENGRYALSPVGRRRAPARYQDRRGFDLQQFRRGLGLLRRARRTRGARIAEIGRLQADNEKLKAQLAAREPTVTGKIDEPLPKSDSLKKAEPKVAEGERKIEIPLPSDRDMDRMMSFLEQAWRRLIEMANRMQKDVTGKI